MSEPLHYRGLVEVGKQIAAGEVTPLEVTQAIFDRIDSLNGQLKAYVTPMREQALEAAEVLGKEAASGKLRGPLHGVPVAVKDLCFTKGVATMGGSAALKDHVPDFDGTVVARLKEAGAIILGKLNLTEGAMAGYNPEFDAPVNPWNADRWTGVSSSGSGVAVAAGLCYGAIGTDTGGSIRTPSAANGVVGIKPTWGRVSRYGVLDLAESLDHVGPITRRVEDAAAFLEAIAGRDPNDPTSSHTPVPPLLNGIGLGISKLRVGVDEEYLTGAVHPEVSAAVRDAIGVLEDAGATRVEVKMPAVEEVAASWVILCAAEAALAHQATYPSKKDRYGPWFQGFLDIGGTVSGADYARVNNLRAAFCEDFAGMLSEIDVLACPSMPFPPFPVTREMLYGPLEIPEDGDPMNVMLQYTAPYDYTGSPTISLPCGFTQDGLPISLQLVAHHWREDVLCWAGHAYQGATDWHTKHPEL